MSASCDLPLLELVPRLSPTIRGRRTEPPAHLAESLVWQLEDAIRAQLGRGQRFFWFSVPPRHWKSETLKHGAVKHLARWPDEGVAYCTHTQAFASAQSRSIRRIAKAAGLTMGQDSNRQDEWELAGRSGGLVARGVGGELTGRGFRLVIIDDPIKSREDAESPTIRAKTWEWIQDDVITRLTPDGTVLLVHTRWHPDDPIGRAKRQPEWVGRNIPALTGAEDDVALLPHVWSAEQLRAIRDANPFRFASLYQGEPRPRGGTVFGEPHWYQPGEAPRVRYSIAHGVDLAYSAKSWADRSVILTGYRDQHGVIYLVDGKIRRERADQFAGTILAAQRAHPGTARWYYAGPERGVADMLATHGCHLNALPATSDKHVRAQPVAAAWNQGRVLLPATGNGHQLDWVSELVEEVGSFTGVNDAHDDVVDALAALGDELGCGPGIVSVDVDRDIAVDSRWGDLADQRGF